MSVQWKCRTRARVRARRIDNRAGWNASPDCWTEQCFFKRCTVISSLKGRETPERSGVSAPALANCSRTEDGEGWGGGGGGGGGEGAFDLTEVDLYRRDESRSAGSFRGPEKPRVAWKQMYVCGRPVVGRPVFLPEQKEHVPLDNAANELSHRRSRTRPGLVNIFITMLSKGRLADKVWRQGDRDRWCSVPRIRVSLLRQSKGCRLCNAKMCAR